MEQSHSTQADFSHGLGVDLPAGRIVARPGPVSPAVDFAGRMKYEEKCRLHLQHLQHKMILSKER